MSKKILGLTLAVIAIMSTAHAEERSLKCHIDLPASGSKDLEVPLVKGGAEISFQYTNDYIKTDIRHYEITAEVWGFEQGVKTRHAGYLSIKQIGDEFKGRPNNAINHCEETLPSDSCNLELNATLNGIGMRAVCEVPAEIAPAKQR